MSADAEPEPGYEMSEYERQLRASIKRTRQENEARYARIDADWRLAFEPLNLHWLASLSQPEYERERERYSRNPDFPPEELDAAVAELKAENAGTDAPQLTKVNDVTPTAVDWLWHPYLPAAQITILGGPGGAGKGLVAIALAARITTHTAWPASDATAPQGDVIWGETEDPLPQVIAPRLIAAAADRARVLYGKPDAFQKLDLRAAIKTHGVRLIVLSPMFSFLQGLTGINEELSVRTVLEQMQNAIEGTPCSVLGLGHTNKKPDLRAIERLLGSIAFTNFVRSVLLVSRDKDNKSWFRLVHAKHNLSVRGDDLLYKPRHVGQDPRDQYVTLDWQRPESGNSEPDELFDRRKPNGHDTSQSAGQMVVSRKWWKFEKAA